MAAPALEPVLVSYEAYLDLERRTGVRHEFLAGAVYAMAGGTPEHAALASNTMVALSAKLAGKPCVPIGSDLKVRIEAASVSTYPDLAVVCGPLERSAQDRNAVVNPTLLVEVLSPGTEAYDRGEKFELYRQLPSLQAYLLVAHDRHCLDLFERTDDGWRFTSAHAGETLHVGSLGVTLDVDALYRDHLGESLARPDPSRAPVITTAQPTE